MWPLQATLIGKSISGYTWTARSSLNNIARMGHMCGGQSALLFVPGLTAGNAKGRASETYDGSSWSITASVSYNRWQGMTDMMGTPTAALLFGSSYSPESDYTELYNGTSWSTGGNMPEKLRFPLGGTLHSDAGVRVGGVDITSADTDEHWLFDGTTWSYYGVTLEAVNNVPWYGWSSDGIGFVGAGHRFFDGSTWSTLSALATVSWSCGCGAPSAAWASKSANGGCYIYHFNGTSWISFSDRGYSNSEVTFNSHGNVFSAGGMTTVQLATVEEFIPT